MFSFVNLSEHIQEDCPLGTALPTPFQPSPLSHMVSLFPEIWEETSVGEEGMEK